MEKIDGKDIYFVFFCKMVVIDIIYFVIIYKILCFIVFKFICSIDVNFIFFKKYNENCDIWLLFFLYV